MGSGREDTNGDLTPMLGGTEGLSWGGVSWTWPGLAFDFDMEVVESTDVSVFRMETLYLVFIESNTSPSEMMPISMLGISSESGILITL